MENQVYCRTVVSKKKTIIFKVLMIVDMICFCLCVVSMLPRQGESRELGSSYYYNIFNDHVSGFEDLLNPFSNCIYWIFFYFFCLLAIVLVLCILNRNQARKCSLELNQDGLFGKKKTFFSTKTINQPFEKIDNVYVKNGIIDKILGGNTIAVRTASSCISLLYIENAEEFVNRTLEELKKYKASVASNKGKDSIVSGGDTMDALLKLKKLLDQGLISQEEFEEKRKEFVNKI